jgi:serine phosphatase RsbU (regulator of sigma subunit)
VNPVAVLLLLLGSLVPAVQAQRADPYVLHADSIRTDPIFLWATWRYQPGDDPAWAGPAFDDHAWARFTPYDYHQLPEGWTGKGWFRLAVWVDSSVAGKPLGFNIHHLGASEVYVDGQLFVRIGRIDSTGGTAHTLRRDPRPRALSLTAGPHLIALRYATLYEQEFWEKGGFQVGIRIAWGWVEDLSLAWSQVHQRQRLLTGIIVTLLWTLAFVHLLIFLFYRKGIENLWFFGFLVCAGLVTWNLIHRNYSQDPLFVLYALRWAVTAAAGLFACGSLFIRAMFHRKPLWWLVALCGAFVAVSWLWRPHFLLTIGVGALCYVDMIQVVARALFGRDPAQRRWARSVSVGVLSLLVGLLGTMAHDLGWLRWSFLDGILLYSFVSMAIAMSFVLAVSFAVKSKRLEAELVRVKELSERTLQQEMDKMRLESELQRQAAELEEARALQLSMLPRQVPMLDGLQIAAYMQTATEVGGDYYDFHLAHDGTLTIAVGDATGHGMRAGTMVTATKGLFNALAAQPDPVTTLQQFTAALKRMNLSKLYMALTLVVIRGREVTVASAGMPHALHYRSGTREVVPVVLKGMPLGAFNQFPYQQHHFTAASGDALLLMSDGFPEAFRPDGEILGDDRALAAYAEVATESAEAALARLVEVAKAWMDGMPPRDDLTFVAIRFV